MSLLNIFSKKKKENGLPKFQNAFLGQYAGLQKTTKQFGFFEKAQVFYKEQQWLDAYEQFFLYLKNPDTENLVFSRNKNKLSFKLIQGSKIITGFINEQEISAEAEVVQFANTNDELMLKLLRQNYRLKYCKFAIKNDIFTVKFFGFTSDTQPASLYRALLEMAVVADRYDDILMLEFEHLKYMNVKHIHHIEGKKVNQRLTFMKKMFGEIMNTSVESSSLNKQLNIKLKFLNSLYAIDYLIGPGGKLQSKIRALIEVLQNEKKEENNLYVTVKNTVSSIYESKEDEFYEDLQGIIRTFPEKEPAELAHINDFIHKHLNKIRLFLEKEKYETAELLIKNLILSLPYHFGMSVSQEKILQILWEYFYPEYFKSIENFHSFFTADVSFDVSKIKAYIASVLKNSKKEGQYIFFDKERLRFENKFDFLLSFIEEFAATKYK